MNPRLPDPQILALALQATVLAHGQLREAATAFASELANGRGCARVGVGFVRGQQVELVAISHGTGENLHRQAFNPLTAAMDEAVQQGASVHWPAEGAPAIRHAHRLLLGERGGAVVTVPIVHLGRAVGAVTCEWTSAPTELPAAVAELENNVSLAGPVLYLMAQREQPWYRRMHQRMDPADTGSRRRTALLAAGAAVLLAALLAWPVSYRVGGHARVEGQQTRAIVVPADGYLQAVHVRPGDRVAQGQLLLEMSDQDLQLQKRKWGSELGQYENAYASALARADRAAMVIALARVEEARAHLGLVESELVRARITAPFAGIVVDGDLTQSLGAPLERGKPLLQLAPLDRYRVMLQVDERDIGHVRVGQTGELALSALPWDALPIRAVRITPMARPVEGRNVFEVETDVTADAERIRPGLEGVGKLDTGRAALGWVWFHGVADWLRLALWSWVA
ncbi:efflux RND transporter periplasmic adaptor subunit [Pseudorhodoferax soli]|uniref:CusB/HlyD membrane fusion family barrel-sandwich protein n=1 Tax=Pseudorhodoferax soli TaxID=545864 RepID=A0A368X788_9BURK|nr:HlyD family efflux transporter periplasmic adaptor subunit [Pseudorhodoferax soli]RCW63871.1 CusB/HlyD membrane fusion family barrel-sandwich protein [Pseudorhodoferax soli]